ncbi:glycosyltransferase [Desulfofalx alkaliphila]|uniref:glycosyltransferase n=1 Tax=Desulfofalx alkaliphila TaxID=105483 RepID=UPI0004E1D52B|nr:glycosyltransferase [Desulfofalx alkaliphila]
MKVCISRNAEARTNAALARVSDALCNELDSVCILSRNRYSGKTKGIKKKNYAIADKIIDNYEINLKSTPGKGITNIIQLIAFQIIVFIWFLRNKDKYDIIHAFDLDVGLPVLLISKIIKKGYVYHIADFYVDSRSALPSKLKPFIRRIEFKVINNAISTIVCTEDRIKQIEGSNPKNLTVIHNTPIVSDELIDDMFKTKKEDTHKQKVVFTYVGGLGKSRFIKSALEVIKDYPQIILNIAGMGTLSNYVEDMSRKYSNINYYGMIDYTEALRLYSKTDFMFALYDPGIPNHKFSAPNKAYEAMMLGKPIIVARNSGIDRIVNDNKMGYVIDYSEESFKELLNRIISRSLDWEELGKNAKVAYNNYSWAEMKKRLIELYKHIT